jgi:hypothetical protein
MKHNAKHKDMRLRSLQFVLLRVSFDDLRVFFVDFKQLHMEELYAATLKYGTCCRLEFLCSTAYTRTSCRRSSCEKDWRLKRRHERSQG